MVEAMLSSGELFTDLDMLRDEVEKVSGLKRLLELACTDQVTYLPYLLSKLREEIMILYHVLDKIESECHHSEEIEALLRDIQENTEREHSEARYYLEVLRRRDGARERSGAGEAQRSDERQVVEGKKPTKAPEAQRLPNEIPLMIPEVLEEVPGGAGEAQRSDERQVVEGKKPTKAPEAQRLPNEIPLMIPEVLEEVPGGAGEAQRRDERQAVEGKKPTKAPEAQRLPNEMPLMIPEVLEEVPGYLKGRITCDQINAVIKNLNKAMMTKYKIRNRHVASLNTSGRALYYRYVKEENRDTEGCYFIVEDDIKLFTNTRMDKSFHNIIIILRHCQRLREIRTSGVVRYVIS